MAFGKKVSKKVEGKVKEPEAPKKAETHDDRLKARKAESAENYQAKWDKKLADQKAIEKRSRDA